MISRKSYNENGNITYEIVYEYNESGEMISWKSYNENGKMISGVIYE